MDAQRKTGQAAFALARQACAALIAIHLALLTANVLRNSITFDEYAHLPAGVAYWKHGYSALPIHNLSPPLLRLIAAGPVVLAGAEAPEVGPFLAQRPRDRHWNYGRAFERANGEAYHRLFVIGRFALLPISCLGLWIVWKWAGELYGPRSAIAAATIWALNPDLIAHGSIVGTDAGTAVAMLAACWAWWKFCGSPNWRWLTFASVLVTLAMLTKFTSLVLWPMLVAIAATRVYERKIVWKRAALGLTVCVAVAWFATNLAYGFRGTFSLARDHPFMSKTLSRLPAAMPVPLPRVLIDGFDVQKAEADMPIPAFLLGEEYTGSRASYYPISLASKLPAALLAVIAIAAVSTTRSRSRAELSVAAPLLVFIIAMVVLTDVNIGVRYVLPAYPLAIILIARIWRDDQTQGVRLDKIASVLLGVMALESLLATPRHLSFMNIIAGGRETGWQVVNDSNYDWGQDLLALRAWLNENGNPPIVLVYFGRVNPGVYGIDYSPITEPRGEPLVAVSSYFLNGLSHRMPTPRGPTDYISLPYAAELRSKPPYARAGDTIFIYEAAQVAAAAREARLKERR